MIIRKSAQEIELMARAGEVVAGTLALMQERLEPGISMLELDRIADDYIASQGGVPTSKGYRGYPAAMCISPNAMIVHGIPGEYRAKEGDIISFDVGVTKDGLIADSAATFAVGEISDEAQRLLEVCKAALDAGIEAARVGAQVGDISAAVQATTEEAGLLGRAQPRRARRRPLLPRGSAGTELRELVHGAGAARGHDAGDRADDHGGWPGGVRARGRLVDFDHGRVARSPFRAHGCHLRRGPAGAHETRKGPGTMTRPRRQAVIFCVWDRSCGGTSFRRS